MGKDLKVKLFKIDKAKKRTIPEIFPQEYSNVYILGKTRSGKTNLLVNLLDKLKNRHTQIKVFSSTVHSDPVWLTLKRIVDEEKENEEKRREQERKRKKAKRSVKDFIEIDDGEDENTPTSNRKLWNIEFYTSFLDDNVLKEFIQNIKENGHPDDKINHLLVFDDLGNDTRDKLITQLCKTNRHLRCNVILSCQSDKQVLPSARYQSNVILLFGRYNDEVLQNVHQDACLGIEFNLFKQLYCFATLEPYSFMRVDTRDGRYYKNLDQLLLEE